MEASVKQDILSSLQIRSLKEEDLPALEWDGMYTHYRELFQIAYQRIASHRGLAWVVEIPDKGIIGQVFIQLTCQRPELANGRTHAYLYSFRIKPTYRRMGIGKTVLNFVDGNLLARNYQFVTLNVSKENLDAIRLYERHGYRTIGPEPGIWNYRDHLGVWHQVVEPAWRMEKALVKQGVEQIGSV
jgi:ribosomal protein S18 acetylase RimI-like enzyme